LKIINHPLEGGVKPTKMKNLIIGIDPDSEKSGLCIIDKDEKKVIKAEALPFPELITTIVLHKFLGEIKCVYVEAGWLNKGNYHGRLGDSRAVSAAKGESVGRNAETGRKIIEMLRYNNIPTCEVKPLRKIWEGPDGKISQPEILEIIHDFPKRANQEVRDAAMLAWVQGGYRIRLTKKKIQK
jgi:hypothetical protein